MRLGSAWIFLSGGWERRTVLAIEHKLLWDGEEYYYLVFRQANGRPAIRLLAYTWLGTLVNTNLVKFQKGRP